MDRLAVAEDLFILGFTPSGAARRPQTILEAGLAAAVLGELRLHRRIKSDKYGMVGVRDATPTGDGPRDRVLAVMATYEPAALRQWLHKFGPYVIATTAWHLRSRDVCQLLDDGSVHWIGGADINQGLTQATRRALVTARPRPAGDERTALLGSLLWATDLTDAVLGRSFRARRRLDTAAKKDWLAQGVRQATGHLHPS